MHVHVVPISTMAHLDFSNADTSPDPDDLDTVAALLQERLSGSG